MYPSTFLFLLSCVEYCNFFQLFFSGLLLLNVSIISSLKCLCCKLELDYLCSKQLLFVTTPVLQNP